MRQKNNKIWIYTAMALGAAVLLWAVSREIPFTPQTVEQPLENTFAK